MTTRQVLCGWVLGLGLLAAAGCGESQPPAATGGTTAEAAGEETPDVAAGAEETEEEGE